MAKIEFPKTVFVYVCDYDEGKPIYAVTTNMEDIEHGEAVATYERVRRGRKVTKHEVVDV